MGKITMAREEFQSHLAGLEQVDRQRSRTVRIYSEALETYIETIRGTKDVAFSLNDKSDDLLEDMVELRSELESVLIPAVDDELFYIRTGRTELGGDIAGYSVHFSEGEFNTYRYLTALQADTSIALQQLASVFSIFDPTLVEAQEERFESSIASIERNMDSLDNEELEARLTPLYEEMRDLGLSRDGIFLVLRSRLLLSDEQAVLLDLSRQQTTSLPRSSMNWYCRQPNQPSRRRRPPPRRSPPAARCCW